MPSEIHLDFDDRLTKLKPGQYRIWHDGQNVMIPAGQSTTKPLTKEIVNVNTRVYGEIHQSYFKKPVVDFTSSNVKIERFDKYFLAIWRDGEDLPYDNPIVDYHDDLGLDRIHIQSSVVWMSDIFTGEFWGDTVFHFEEDKTWCTDKLHFHNFALQELFGDFFMVTNPLDRHLSQGFRYDTSLFLQEINLPISMILERTTIKNGNSEMKLQLQNNPEYPVIMHTFDMVLKGGE